MCFFLLRNNKSHTLKQIKIHKVLYRHSSTFTHFKSRRFPQSGHTYIKGDFLHNWFLLTNIHFVVEGDLLHNHLSQVDHTQMQNRPCFLPHILLQLWLSTQEIRFSSNGGILIEEEWIVEQAKKPWEKTVELEPKIPSWYKTLS